jgi:hypothetical protein
MNILILLFVMNMNMTQRSLNKKAYYNVINNNEKIYIKMELTIYIKNKKQQHIVIKMNNVYKYIYR